MRKLSILTSLALLLSATSAYAAEGLLTGDTFITTANAAGNFGASPKLAVGSGSTSLAQFSLSTLPPGTQASSVAKASLLVYINRVTVAGNVSVSLMTASFVESTANYTNSDAGIAAVPFAGPFPVGPAQLGTYLLVDVTSQVQNALIPGFVGFALIPDATVVAQFDSKENTATSHPPQLLITLTSNGPAGPIGPAGPTGAARSPRCPR